MIDGAISRGLLVVMLLLVTSSPLKADEDFQRDIVPILQARCVRCHGSEKKKGDFDAEGYRQMSQVVADLKQWRQVGEVVASGKMPPKGQPPLDAGQREQVARWLKETIQQAESATPVDPGPTFPRRITRREYREIIKDLFDADADVETYLPEARSASGYDNQVAQLAVPPELLERYLLLAERVLDRFYGNVYNTRQKEPIKSWFLAWEGEEKRPARAAAELDLRALAKLAFRRPPEDQEIAALMKLFETAYVEKKGFHESLRFAIKGLLVSPQFLFRVESLPDDDEPKPVDDFELASRLSFFLWSSLPDQELLNLAAGNELHKPEVLRGQVQRMVKHAKIRGLAAHFPPQWLFGRLANHPLDPVLFPDYTPGLVRSAAEELSVYFQKLIQEQKSVVELLDSDYTYINEDLAGIYGVKDITGPALQRVKLTNRRRGGLVGMAIAMQRTSMPNRTSPTIRGKWVLDSLLGEPPAPPPPTVDNSVVDSKKPSPDGTILGFRDRLNLHAEQGSSCGGCHRKIDPLGYSLENYDPLGRFREKENDRPVFNSGKLPDGTDLQGVESVKDVLLERKEPFLRNLVEHMLVYALGRDLQTCDLPTVRLITDAVKTRNYRADVLIEEIVLSYPFLHKRAPRPSETAHLTGEKRR